MAKSKSKPKKAVDTKGVESLYYTVGLNQEYKPVEHKFSKEEFLSGAFVKPEGWDSNSAVIFSDGTKHSAGTLGLMNGDHSDLIKELKKRYK